VVIVDEYVGYNIVGNGVGKIVGEVG